MKEILYISQKKKIEEAKNKFKKGYERYLKELPLINKEREINEQCKELLLLEKKNTFKLSIVILLTRKLKRSK